MRTPFPWAQSDRQPRLIFFDNLGVVDFKRPVARFTYVDDANTVMRTFALKDEVLATLRDNLVILQDELKNRQFSGVPDYIEPVLRAVERTKKTIAQAEGWT